MAVARAEGEHRVAASVDLPFDRVGKGFFLGRMRALETDLPGQAP